MCMSIQLAQLVECFCALVVRGLGWETVTHIV